MTKFYSNIKLVFIKFLILFFISCFSSYSNEFKNVVTVGSHDALVKIKIFSSLTCPHCANFHLKIVPKIEKEYVEPGKVQLIFIDFPLDQASFNASKLLHCLDKEKRINFLDIIYKNQKKWTAGSNIDDINKNSRNFEKKINEIKNQNIRNSLTQLLNAIKNV